MKRNKDDKEDTQLLKRLTSLKKEFIVRYGVSDKEIIYAEAPARVNIIGEHIDYNGGLVFPAAINLFLTIALRKRSDGKIVYESIQPDLKRYEFSVNGKFEFNSKNEYANYLNGMLKYFTEQGLTVDSGFEILIASEIPSGSSISSSAALEMCFGKIIASAFHFDIDGITLAKIGKRTENEFIGLQSGIMDQFIIAMGKKDSAILLDTASLSYEYIPLNIEPYRIIVMNSNKPRKLSESKYNERKNECDVALAFLKQKTDIRFLCSLTPSSYKPFEKDVSCYLGETVARRVRHCVSEMERVRASAAALQKNDIAALGRLLKESHLSLKNDYEVTGRELDSLFFAAIEQEGCLGARMTGAGFSGCAIALVHKDGFERFAENVGKKYKEETGLTAGFFACTASSGARVL